MEKSERILHRKVMAVVAEVENILKKEFGVQWFRPSDEDAIRLLRLSQWRERYRVSIAYQLWTLLPIWRQQFAKLKQSKGLGVSISTLTGKKSEEILKQKIGDQFPDGELTQMWKAGQQQLQWSLVWDRTEKKEDWEHPGAVVLEYQRRMQVERRYRKKFAQEQQKRHYRGNPWIG